MARPDVGTGYIHLYTGEGKGKTSAALGLALRAVGNGLSVLVLQFLKAEESGERKAARRLAPGLEIRSLGGKEFIDPDAISAEDRARAEAGLSQARAGMLSGRWDVLVLDEINTAVHFGLLSLSAVLGLLKEKPPGVELILTGRNAPQELIACADLVTEMREIKHYFHHGVLARKGIER